MTLLRVAAHNFKGGDSPVCMCPRDKRRNDKDCNDEEQEKENISNLRNNAQFSFVSHLVYKQDSVGRSSWSLEI